MVNPGTMKLLKEPLLHFPLIGAASFLINSLSLEAKLGTNPYQFGLIGGSDARRHYR
jgi:hypothetical protein